MEIFFFSDMGILGSVELFELYLIKKKENLFLKNVVGK